MTNLATDSDGQVFSGKQVEETTQIYSKLRAKRQSVGTKSAKRKLKRVSEEKDGSRRIQTM
jgi:putative transposase